MEWIYWVGVLVLLSLFFFLKGLIWDKPREEIQRLKKEVNELSRRHQQEITALRSEYEDHLSLAESDAARARKNYEKIQFTLNQLESNISAVPYMAGMIADIETYGLEKLALGISWSRSQVNRNKVKSIREIRKDAQLMVERNKEAQYQLGYLLALYPGLSDVIECEFKQLPSVQLSELSEHDSTRDYLSKEEYEQLSVTQRNQLALDRYVSSHNKTKWQIGRDYEQYVAYKFRELGFEVDEFGSYMGLEDLGRDLIAKRDDIVWIVQCKYWSSVKQIHEKHITQLYGTMTSYCIENGIAPEKVTGVLVTNIHLSDMAQKMANHLGILYWDEYSMGEYPRIKCNIGHDEYGETRIYHLPFDRQYDVTKIKHKGECYAMTVAEAEAKGFRRTYKWFGSK